VLSDFWGSFLYHVAAAELDVGKLWQVNFFSSDTSIAFFHGLHVFLLPFYFIESVCVNICGYAWFRLVVWI
jgi:hypothetical protein